MLHGCTQGPDDFAVGTGLNGSPRSAASSSPIRRSRGAPTLPPAGTGSISPTSAATKANRRLSRGSPAPSWPSLPSTRPTSMWRGSRPAARWRRSSARPIPIFTRPRASTRGAARRRLRPALGLRGDARRREAAPSEGRRRARPHDRLSRRNDRSSIQRTPRRSRGRGGRPGGRRSWSGRRRGRANLHPRRRDRRPRRPPRRAWAVEGLGHAWSGGRPEGRSPTRGARTPRARWCGSFWRRRGDPCSRDRRSRLARPSTAPVAAPCSPNAASIRRPRRGLARGGARRGRGRRGRS